MSNQTNELKNMMASFFQMNTASTSGTGSLPSNIVANPKGELKAITTRSGLVLDGPSIPMPPPFINPEEDEHVEETLTDPDLGEFTIKVPPPLVQKSKPSSQRNYVVHQRDPRLPELISTQMTLELANREICTPVGIARDVFVPVGRFTFPADFIIVDYESDPRVPLILGRPFLRTARALIDVHGEEMILCDVINPLSGSTTSSSLSLSISETIDYSLEEFADELTHFTFPPGIDYLLFDAESDLREIEYFSDEHALDYSPHPLCVIMRMKLLILRPNFLPLPESDLVFYEVYSEVDSLSSTDNEDKVFNPGILIHENLFEITIRVTNCAKNVKKTSNASLILEDFNPPLYELPFHKEVPGSETLLSFSFENEEKVFNPGIHTFKGVHTSLLSELSHRGPKAFKVIKIFESPMEIFPCSYGEDIRVLDVPCLHFYPP
ncbi:reverse transcriptase domain-containing protein [Tanacetum coccineum]